MIVSRTELIDYCLRRLGFPVLEINVDDDQVADRINDALQFFGENIYDGIEKVFLQHTITDQNVIDKSVEAADPILGVIRIFPARGLFSGSFFNQEFQLRITDLNEFTGLQSIDFYINATNFNLLEQLLATERAFRFNKVKNNIEISVKWGIDLKAGDVIIIEAYRILDPQTYTEIYDHAFMKQYATALIKQQWGINLKKFEGVQLPGGITVNGQTIYDEATDEILRIEEEILSKWQIPPLDLIG